MKKINSLLKRRILQYEDHTRILIGLAKACFERIRHFGSGKL